MEWKLRFPNDKQRLADAVAELRKGEHAHIRALRPPKSRPMRPPNGALREGPPVRMRSLERPAVHRRCRKIRRSTIADAIPGGCELLEVHCWPCNHIQLIDLTLAVWPRQLV